MVLNYKLRRHFWYSSSCPDCKPPKTISGKSTGKTLHDKILKFLQCTCSKTQQNNANQKPGYSQPNQAILNPYQAILNPTRPFSTTPGHSQPHQAILNHTRPFSTTPGHSQPHQAILNPTRPFSTQPGHSQPNQAILNPTRPFLTQPGYSQPNPHNLRALF